MKLWQVLVVVGTILYIIGYLLRVLHWEFFDFITGRIVQYMSYIFFATAVITILLKKKKDH
jgi:hypothetical protein